MTAELGTDEFVGYTFEGSPPRRPRLWFLDRQLYPLTVWGSSVIWPGWYADQITDRIRWGESVDPSELRAQAAEFNLDVGHWTMGVPWRASEHRAWPSTESWDVVMPGLTMRYEHWGVEDWNAVWKLTELTIPHVHTFGREDTWRLGVWPD